MAAADGLLSEDQFLCSICLDVFTDPVTIPCGHNFCRSCITEHWDVNVQSRCPLCKELFARRPELRVNTFISEMAALFRQSVQKKASNGGISEERCAQPGDILCDICPETRGKALKSCLVCLVSYCETHLEPHRRIAGLKRHELIDPVENPEDRVCKDHGRPLELFCKTYQMCVCRFCVESSHRLHHGVPLIEEYEVKKAELGKTEAGVQQMIQDRRLKIQEIKRTVELGKEDAARETEAGVQIFAALTQLVERSLSELIEEIKEKQEATERQAEGFVAELEQEISELLKRSSELEQLLHTSDHLRFLQGFPLNAAPPFNDWTEVRVCSSHEGEVRMAVDQLENTLSIEMEKLCIADELKRLRRFATDVTLDPQTANRYLILSDDGKRVSQGDRKKKIRRNPNGFSRGCVLGTPGFSTGKFYYEVQVEGKSGWTLGVVRGSVNRKNSFIPMCPWNGYWTVALINGNQYTTSDDTPLHLSPTSLPQKVGVFVDYEEAVVSLYDVEAAALIYSFTRCLFAETLYPYFSPGHNNDGENVSSLTIYPINHTE